MVYRIVRVVAAIAVVFASLPLSLLAIERGFGLGAMLTVPTCCLGFWFALVSGLRTQRIGWFAFSSINVFLLPLCPYWKRMIETVLHWVQDIIRSSQPTALYDNAEVVALLAMIVLPWGIGCGLGAIAARLTRRYLSDTTFDADDESRPTYQFTVRGMLLTIMVFAAMTGWLSTTVQQWYSHEKSNQERLLQRFKGSFTTGKVTLLAEPLIFEDHAMLKKSQNTSGISEYRVVAPINIDGNQLWAVWTYLCDENYPGTVSKFGYAEAGTRSGLPPHPFPVTEYLREPTYEMVDGEPPLSIGAKIVEAPTVARSGDTITILAKTDSFMECDLIIRPFQAVALPPGKLKSPESGVVRWDVAIDPTFVGTQIEYEFQSRTNRLYRAKIVSGKLTLTRNSVEQRVADEALDQAF
jgi:hypothetical protein